MVELGSYSSVDWSDGAINRDKAKALKSKSPKAILCNVPVRLMGQTKAAIAWQNHIWGLAHWINR